MNDLSSSQRQWYGAMTMACWDATCCRSKSQVFFFFEKKKKTRTYVDAQFTFFRPPKHEGLEKRSISLPKSSVEDRECIIDSGASLHKMGCTSLTPEERKTVKNTIFPALS